MNLPAFALDVSSLFASDPERGRRVLDLMRKHDVSLTWEWIEAMQKQARRVYDGLEPIPERQGRAALHLGGIPDA